MSHIVSTDEGPRSSCCGATITVTKEYTDTHVYTVKEYDAETGVATYGFTKTNDGIDGDNFRAECDNCSGEIVDDIEWKEL